MMHFDIVKYFEVVPTSMFHMNVNEIRTGKSEIWQERHQLDTEEERNQIHKRFLSQRKTDNSTADYHRRQKTQDCPSIVCRLWYCLLPSLGHWFVNLNTTRSIDYKAMSLILTPKRALSSRPNCRWQTGNQYTSLYPWPGLDLDLIVFYPRRYYLLCTVEYYPMLEKLGYIYPEAVV